MYNDILFNNRDKLDAIKDKEGELFTNLNGIKETLGISKWDTIENAENFTDDDKKKISSLDINKLEDLGSLIMEYLGATKIIITMRDVQFDNDTSNSYQDSLDQVVFGLHRNDDDKQGKYQNSHPNETTPPDNYIIIPKFITEAEYSSIENNNRKKAKLFELQKNRGICENLSPNNMGVLLDGNGIYGPFGEVYSPKSMEGQEKTEKGPNPSQIYENSLKNYINKIESGSNVIIFGFGFSGSGKTYSLVEAEDSIVINFMKEGLNVDRVDLSVEEFYPYVEGGNMEEETGIINFNEYVPGFEEAINFKLGKDFKKVKNRQGQIAKQEFESYFKIDENGNFIDKPVKPGDSEFNKKYSFKNILKEIELARFNNMHIAPTPNNPVSSRGHLFYTFSFPETKYGNFIIMDMAGTENTIQIRNDLLFLNDLNKEQMVKVFNQKNIYIGSNKIYEKLNELINPIYMNDETYFFNPNLEASKEFEKSILTKFDEFIC